MELPHFAGLRQSATQPIWPIELGFDRVFHHSLSSRGQFYKPLFEFKPKNMMLLDPGNIDDMSESQQSDESETDAHSSTHTSTTIESESDDSMGDGDSSDIEMDTEEEDEDDEMGTDDDEDVETDQEDKSEADQTNNGESSDDNQPEPWGIYLRAVRMSRFREELQMNRRRIGIAPPPSPLEKSFNAFTAALARTLLVAKFTPPSPSVDSMAMEAEFLHYRTLLNFKINTEVPSQVERDGNFLAVKRMLMMSLARWQEVWDPTSLPSDVKKPALYRDIMRSIIGQGKRRLRNDYILTCCRQADKVFAYAKADWQTTLEEDLKSVDWAGFAKM
ncbi:hypothetical protein V5O48_015818 [Marasmius crinis-equi]|uniref:Uncharacterized protein n=1 Tax=Marasmius crinis-equi TaxID=585013 RepID=A0ABR3ETF1_9AGAR